MLKFLKGLLLVLGVMCLWGLGIYLLAYVTSLIPAVIVGGIVAVAVLVMFVRFTEIYGKD